MHFDLRKNFTLTNSYIRKNNIRSNIGDAELIVTLALRCVKVLSTNIHIRPVKTFIPIDFSLQQTIEIIIELD